MQRVLWKTFRDQAGRQKVGNVKAVVVVVLVDVVKEVRQPCLDIDSGKFAAAHHRVHHGGILGCIVVLAEEVILASQRNRTLPVLNKIGVYPALAVDDIAT